MQDFIIYQIVVTKQTATDWQIFCKACLYFVRKFSEKLGGPGIIEEIEKPKLTKEEAVVLMSSGIQESSLLSLFQASQQPQCLLLHINSWHNNNVRLLESVHLH